MEAATVFRDGLALLTPAGHIWWVGCTTGHMRGEPAAAPVAAQYCCSSQPALLPVQLLGPAARARASATDACAPACCVHSFMQVCAQRSRAPAAALSRPRPRPGRGRRLGGGRLWCALHCGAAALSLFLWRSRGAQLRHWRQWLCSAVQCCRRCFATARQACCDQPHCRPLPFCLRLLTSVCIRLPGIPLHCHCHPAASGDSGRGGHREGG